MSDKTLSETLWKLARDVGHVRAQCHDLVWSQAGDEWHEEMKVVHINLVRAFEAMREVAILMREQGLRDDATDKAA